MERVISLLKSLRNRETSLKLMHAKSSRESLARRT
jgi:hypothetical protein